MVPHQVDPLVLGTSNFFCPQMEEHFSVFLHPNGVSAWALQEKAQKLFQGLVLGEAKYVPPPHAPLHVHERPGARAFGPEAAQASDMDDFV